MKVSKKTIRNFLQCWYIMSDNPTDWQEICADEMDGPDKEVTIEKIEKFISDLEEYSSMDVG